MKARRRGAVWVCDAPTPHTEELERVVEEESTAWGVPYASKPWRMIEEEVATYGAADHITVASRYAKQTYVERGIPPNRITVIPYGIDVGHFAPRPRREQCGFQVLFAGTMSPLKGVQYLAAAMRLAAIPDSKLVLVGAVLPETQRLLDGAPNVEIRGHVERSVLPDYFSDADVMVLPSLSDGFGLVIGQALACGCPVIATETTGGSDMLTDGVNGFVVPARSAEAIAEKLTWLYEHPLERQEMRARALESVRHLGGWDTYGDALVALFTRLRRERL
jgi:glycosyltransferase involved in cell wall biosynthesis